MGQSPIQFERNALTPDDPRWALVLRIVESPHFSKAPQLRDILLYVSHRVLEDNPASIGEQEIGCKALGRRDGFNPNEDNIVRVQLRQIRKRLEAYFNTDGSEERLILVIPRGSYVPRFEPRSTGRPLVETGGAAPEAPVAVPFPAPVAAAPKSSSRRLTRALLGCAAIAIALASVFAWRWSGLWTGATAARASDSFWSSVFEGGQPTTVIVADSCLVMLQDILNLDVSLSDYVSGAYLKSLDSVSDRRFRENLQLIARRQYTSLGDLNVATRLVELAQRYKVKPALRYARHLNTRDFKTGNFVLIGSRRSIPWVQLFESKLAFWPAEDRVTRRHYFRNRSPRSGERLSYGLESDAGNANQSYADVALLPNLSGTGYVIILSGLSMAATEAAGEWVTSPSFSSALAKVLKERPSGEAPWTEFLVQVHTLPGTAQVVRAICHRAITAPKPGV